MLCKWVGKMDAMVLPADSMFIAAGDQRLILTAIQPVVSHRGPYADRSFGQIEDARRQSEDKEKVTAKGALTGSVGPGIANMGRSRR